MSKLGIVLGRGIFMWDAPERRTQRYGYVFGGNSTYENDVFTKPEFNDKLAERLKDKQVKLSVKVLQARKSGHVGDLYINVMPSQPQVGEEMVLGVGKFDFQPNPFTEGCYDVALVPEDGREEYWFDPHILYRLHDQTVEFYAKLTDEPCHAAPDIKPVRAAGAISNGDGSIQLVGKHFGGLKEGDTIKVKAKATRLGAGLFSIERPNAEGNKGEVFEVGD